MNVPLFSLVLLGKDTLWQTVKRCIRLWMKPLNHDLVLNAAIERLCYVGTGICSVGYGDVSRGHEDAASHR